MEVSNRLVKIMFIYEFMYETKNKTKIVDKTVKNLKKYLRNILLHQETLYRVSQKKKREVHSKAWNTVFENMNTSKFIAIGFFIQDLYDSDDFSKVVGKNTMDKVLSSYFFSEQFDDQIMMEKNSTLFAKEILSLLDGKKELTPFQIKMQEMKIES